MKKEISKIRQRTENEQKNITKGEKQMKQRIEVLQTELNKTFDSKQQIANDMSMELDKTMKKHEENIKILRNENK